jgi:hypothetical protein
MGGAGDVRADARVQQQRGMDGVFDAPRGANGETAGFGVGSGMVLMLARAAGNE